MISGAKDGAIRAMTHGVPVGPDLASEAPASSRVLDCRQSDDVIRLGWLRAPSSAG